MAVFLGAMTPTRQRFAVVTYRTGCAPPAETLSWWMQWRGGWWLPWPLGYIANRTVFAGRWTVRVAPQGHDGPSWTVRLADEGQAAARASELKTMIDGGQWDPDLEPIPVQLPVDAGQKPHHRAGAAGE